MEKMPIKITPCPIVEAIIEIRFTTMLPSEAIFGIIYNAVTPGLNLEVKKLPILQIPEAVRSQDPNLTYSAHYSLISMDSPLILNIGPRSITFANTNKYVGWPVFFTFISNLLDKIKSTKVIHLPERIGVRYINFFEYSIISKLNAHFEIKGRTIEDEGTNFRTEYTDQDITVVTQISNNVQVGINNIQKQGSLVDIDCIHNFNTGSNSNDQDFTNIIQNCHNKEKETFFGLLRTDFLATLSPEFEE